MLLNWLLIFRMFLRSLKPGLIWKSPALLQKLYLHSVSANMLLGCNSGRKVVMVTVRFRPQLLPDSFDFSDTSRTISNVYILNLDRFLPTGRVILTATFGDISAVIKSWVNKRIKS